MAAGSTPGPSTRNAWKRGWPTRRGSNPADAYGLLRAAIDDPDPVVVVENKAMYASRGELPDTPGPTPIGQAATARSGRDATVVAYGAAVGLALTAAHALSDDGIDVEVIDLRSLQPWDEPAVLESLARTHRLVVAHEAVEAFGVGAEVAARMADVGFRELSGPIVRVGAPFSSPPFARTLEQAFRPDAQAIVRAVRRTFE